jgi:hypothetical protein
MRLLKRKAVVVAMALAMVVGTSATAFAWWSSGGTGGGSASAADPGTGTVTVNQTSTTSGLFPDGPHAELKGNFDNNSGSKLYVSQVAATIADVDKPGCGVENFVLEPATTPVNLNLDPGTGVGSWSGIKIRMVDTGLNQDACKGATVALEYTSS